MTDTNVTQTAVTAVNGLNPFNSNIGLQDVVVKYFDNVINVLSFNPILLLFVAFETFAINWVLEKYVLKQFSFGLFNYLLALFVAVITFPIIYPFISGRFGL